MVDEKMCVGVVKDELMARIGIENYEDALKKEGCKEMNFTGRAMKGYVFLSDDAIDLDVDLEYWLQLALDFNPLAKASKKRKKWIGKRNYQNGFTRQKFFITKTQTKLPKLPIRSFELVYILRRKCLGMSLKSFEVIKQ